MKKIDFKKPKYIIPLIFLPFFFIFNYLFMDFFPEDKMEVSKLEDKQELNISMPSPNLDKIGIDDKMDNLRNAFKAQTDISAISEEIKEGEINEEITETAYTDEEVERIKRLQDSVAAARLAQRNIIGNTTGNSYQTNTGNPGREELERQKQAISGTNSNPPEDDQFIREMKMLDSILNPDKYIQEELPVEKAPIVNRDIKKVENPANKKNPHFNNVTHNESTEHIKGLVDEELKVYLGSRIRIKLSNDIIIDGLEVKKNSYVYGIVSTFKAQRVEIKVQSIVVNNNIVEVDLDVYDLDGIKGLYVPSSQLREFAQELGSQSSNNAGTSIQVQDQNFAQELASELTRTTSQTLSKLIKKTSANIKYNTRVILINNKI